MSPMFWLFFCVFVACVAALFFACSTWFESRWWMIEPWGGMKIVAIWLLGCMAVFSIPAMLIL